MNIDDNFILNILVFNTNSSIVVYLILYLKSHEFYYTIGFMNKYLTIILFL